MSSLPFSNLLIKSGRVVAFRKDTYWAERGLIRCLAGKTGEFTTMTVKTALEHLDGLNQIVRNSRHKQGYYRRDEIDEIQQFTGEMLEVIREAKRQGDPMDARVRRQMMGERTSPVMVTLPKRSPLDIALA